ncbi:MAG TPA: hypothetical protein VGU46_11280 [Acidobacteriaceae bacterium]|nr:hypothetical protein [Acidobacteriaceae bacterium]
MNKVSSFILLIAFTLPTLAQTTPQTWLLASSTLTYHMSHPIHEVDGVTHAARGKGTCADNLCDFLIAAPVKTFDSGDTNRDLHMLQVTRGAQYPVVTVRLRIPQSAISSSTLDCDLEVQFAGNTAHYAHVPFHQEIHGTEHHITGVVPSTLTDFKITPPSFLTVPIRNEIPVRVDMLWHPAS